MKRNDILECVVIPKIDSKQRGLEMDIEYKILVSLIDILEKEKMISVEERNLAIKLIKKEPLHNA